MKKTLQDQYLLIKEGKGHKGVFLNEAKRQFPQYVPNAATFEEAVASLKTKSVISENVIGLTTVAGYEPRKKESYETAFEAFLAEAKKKKENDEEKVKAEEKKVSKPVEEDLSKINDNKDEKNPDNMIFGQIMMGYYAEMKDPKNSEKTMEQLKDIVFKNLAKDPIYYTKNAQFGVKDLGYTDEATALGVPKEPKGKYASSGYGNLSESKEREELKKTIKKQVTEPSKKEKPSDKEIKDKLKKKREEELERRKKAGESLEEIKLRSVIQEMIDSELGEAYQMLNITPGGGEKGDAYIPQFYILPPEARKKLNLLNPGENAPAYNEEYMIPHVRVIPGNIIAFSNWLVQAIQNPKDRRNPLVGMLNDLVRSNEDFRAFLTYVKKFIGTNKVIIPTRGKNATYFELTFPQGYEVLPLKDWTERELDKAYEKLERAQSGEVRRGRPVNIEGLKRFIQRLETLSQNPEGGMVVVLPPFFGESSSNLDSLMEGVEKDLAAINKEAEHEVLQSKLDKIDALIDKKRSQLGKLDEDEDMKALTDKKKVKELEKDIRSLEAARKKVEKMMGKFKGKKSAPKEVIDEMEDEPSAEYLQYKEDAENRYDAGESIDSILDTYNNISLDMKDMLRNDLEGKFGGSDY